METEYGLVKIVDVTPFPSFYSTFHYGVLKVGKAA